MGVKWNPLDPAFRADPYPIYQQLLEKEPLHRSPFGPLAVSRYDDVVAVLRNPAASTDVRKTARVAPQQNLETPAFLFLDPPDHTRLRGLVNRAFTPKRAEQLRSRAQEIVDGILDRAAAEGGMEVVSELAFPLPVLVICEMLGVPPEDVEQFKEWSAALARSLDPSFALPPGFQEKAVNAEERAMDYFRDLVARRRKEPRDDVLTALIQAEEQGDKLSEAEVLATLDILLIAGHETTVNLIANGVLAFGRHPEQFARLRENPSLVRSAVEEILRFDPPVHLMRRNPLEDIEVSCGTIRRFSELVLLPAAAGRDPAHFESPDAFDISREDNRHLGFGFGIHHCVGAPLARMEAQVAFGSLARRFKEIVLEQDPPEYKDNIVLRGVASLPVRFSI